jgi:hypothetical protein
MKLGTLLAVAAISPATVSGASAQVFVADADAYAAPAYVAPAPLYAAAPAPVIVNEPAYVVTAPPIGGYVAPKYSYTINGNYGATYATYRGMGTCFVDINGFRTCD